MQRDRTLSTSNTHYAEANICSIYFVVVNRIEELKANMHLKTVWNKLETAKVFQIVISRNQSNWHSFFLQKTSNWHYNAPLCYQLMFFPLLLINAQLIYKQKIRWIDGPKPYKSKTDIRYIHNTSNKKESETYKGEHCSRKKIPFRTADRFPNLNNVRYWFPTISLFHSLWYYQPILETALDDRTRNSHLFSTIWMAFRWDWDKLWSARQSLDKLSNNRLYHKVN